MEKSAEAFRTISEVAEDLDLPQHVLRFWETRFPQVRPLKRAGGRRYYRPTDVVLLRSIRQLLYDQGYTIKGVQRLLREQGARGLRAGEQSVTSSSGGSEPEAEELAADDVVGSSINASGPVRAFDETEAVLDRDSLKEALACIEECERILLALSRSTV